MEKIITAFENETTALRVKELLEGGGVAACLVCRTADQVRRAIRKLPAPVVVCGYKLGDQTAEALFDDLPPACAMLVLAPQDRLDLLENCDIFRLPAPASRGGPAGLGAAAAPGGAQTGAAGRSQRDAEEQEVIRRAKALLMERDGMTEAQAHRYLQKHSMDSKKSCSDRPGGAGRRRSRLKNETRRSRGGGRGRPPPFSWKEARRMRKQTTEQTGFTARSLNTTPAASAPWWTYRAGPATGRWTTP